jgi:hypothetical protein
MSLNVEPTGRLVAEFLSSFRFTTPDAGTAMRIFPRPDAD